MDFRERLQTKHVRQLWNTSPGHGGPTDTW